MRARACLVAGLVAIAACGPQRSAVTSHGAIGGDVVARVGAVTIPASLVGEVASVQGTAPRDALDRLVDDALAAQGAQAAGLDRAPSVAWSIESILGRAVVDRIAETSRATPPTDAEIEELTQANWRQLDRPEALRVIHAIILRPKDEAKADLGRAIAAKIAAAVAGAKDADDFESRAKAVPHEGFELVVQRLDPFVADGRTTEGPPQMNVAPFTKAAFTLSKPGDTTGVVETQFGWHVIRLLERIPPHHVPLDERRAMLTASVISKRAKDAFDAQLASARAARKVETMPDALTLMEGVNANAPHTEAP